MELEDRHRLMELDTRLVELATVHDPERFRRLVAAEVNRRRERDGVDRLSKQRRSTSLTHWVDDAGMVNLRARYDPERGQRLLNRIRLQREAIVAAGREPADCPEGDLRWEHLSAVALYDLTAVGCVEAVSGAAAAAGPFGGSESGANPWATELVVVIDEASLRSGLHSASRVDAGPVDLPIETVRRLACDAGILPVVLGGDSVVLDMGRSRRLATHEQRLALRVMYHTCAIPGCDVGFDWCRPHHLDPWKPRPSGLSGLSGPSDASDASASGVGGPTDLANLVPLCSRHHHAAHEGGWQLRLDATTRQLTVVRPDGAVLIGGPNGVGAWKDLGAEDVSPARPAA